ncbi:hypothetical protein DFJ77DRAFT_477467 [Powellomyces hirtus]|nr:hypothetical protein DFJ77DRAFT_477467 [Powellomyces hirtus]
MAPNPNNPNSNNNNNNNSWTNSHHALLTFGIEDFGHGNAMPQFASFMEACAKGIATASEPHPQISVQVDDPADQGMHNTNNKTVPHPLITEEMQNRKLSSTHSGSDMQDVESPSSATASMSTGGGPRKKKNLVVEEDAHCRRCNTQIAVFLLHGDGQSLQVPHEIDVLCMSCAGVANPAAQDAVNDPSSSAANTANIVPGSRKRTGPSRQAERAACDVCKRIVAIGAVRLSADPKDRDRDIEPEFEAEIICCSCRSKYALCTECGGGGKYRTGKWRPLGLFQPGRRTCKLPHVRIGATPIQFSEWLVPDTLDADLAKRSIILGDIEKAVPFMYYHRLAVPEVMELTPPNELATFEMLEARVAIRCKYLRDFVLNPSIEKSETVRRYFGAAWIEKVSRHKKDKSKKQQQQQNLSTTADEGKMPTSQSMMVAMITVWWDMSSGCLRLSALQALNTEFTSGSLVFRLTRHVLERIVRDQKQIADENPHRLFPPIEVLGLPVFEEFARLPGVQQTLERLGFSDLNDFEKSHPELDRATVERALIDVGGLFGGQPKYSRAFYVGSVSTILAGPWGLEAVPRRKKKSLGNREGTTASASTGREDT